MQQLQNQTGSLGRALQAVLVGEKTRGERMPRELREVRFGKFIKKRFSILQDAREVR